MATSRHYFTSLEITIWPRFIPHHITSHHFTSRHYFTSHRSHLISSSHSTSFLPSFSSHHIFTIILHFTSHLHHFISLHIISRHISSTHSSPYVYLLLLAGRSLWSTAAAGLPPGPKLPNSDLPKSRRNDAEGEVPRPEWEGGGGNVVR